MPPWRGILELQARFVLVARIVSHSVLWFQSDSSRDEFDPLIHGLYISRPVKSTLLWWRVFSLREQIETPVAVAETQQGQDDRVHGDKDGDEHVRVHSVNSPMSVIAAVVPISKEITLSCKIIDQRSMFDIEMLMGMLWLGRNGSTRLRELHDTCQVNDASDCVHTKLK